MARRTSGKISRRRAVAMLGAGTVISAVRSGEGRAVRGAQGTPCYNPARAVSYMSGSGSTGTPPRKLLLVDGCCSETRNNILAGVGGPPGAPQGRAHLREVIVKLQQETLAEYVFMLWGLDAEQVKQMQSQAETQFKLKVVPSQTPK